MKLPDNFQLYWEDFQTRWSKVQGYLNPEKPNTMMELFRPNLHTTPAPAKRFLEPIIASAGIITLMFLTALALGNFAMLMICT